MVSPVVCLNEGSGREAVRVEGLQGLGIKVFPIGLAELFGGRGSVIGWREDIPGMRATSRPGHVPGSRALIRPARRRCQRSPPPPPPPPPHTPPLFPLLGRASPRPLSPHPRLSVAAEVPDDALAGMESMLRSSSRPCGLHPSDPTQWMGGNRARALGSPSPLMLLLSLSPLPFCTRLRQWGLNIPATIP